MTQDATNATDNATPFTPDPIAAENAVLPSDGQNAADETARAYADENAGAYADDYPDQEVAAVPPFPASTRVMGSEAAQALRPDTRPDTRPGAVRIPYEWLAYALLLLIALALRFAELDVVPLSAPEAREALAAYRAVMPSPEDEVDAVAPVPAIIPESPLMFAVQSISFATLGGDEVYARAAIALAGTLLIFAPLLFRPLLGRGRAFALCVLLFCSPILLFASRESAPTVWAAWATVLLLYCLWQFGRARRREQAGTTYGAAAVVFGAALVFLAEPAGALWLLLVAFAGVVGMWLAQRSDGGAGFDFTPEDVADTRARDVFNTLRALPWGVGVAAAALIIGLVATGLFLNPAGLSAVGELLSRGVAGFAQPYTGLPTPITGYAFLNALFYEPFVLVFALISLLLLARQGALSPVDRFFAAWIVGAFFLSLIYSGARPAHALWFTLPAAGLTSSFVVRLFSTVNRPGEWQVPAYSRWVLALLVVMLLAAFTVAFQSVTRTLVEAPDGDLARASFEAPMAVLLIVSVMFIIISTFMAGTVWSSRAAGFGLGGGILLFGLLSSLGAGWDGAVTRADDPTEFYHMARATHRDTALLRATLMEVADRQSAGFTEMPLHVVAAPDSPAAWLVRDFPNATFAPDFRLAAGQEVIISAIGATPEDLGAAYVGQDFTLNQTWSPETLLALDVLGWWSDRRVREPLTTLENVDLWLRQDVYDGVQQFSAGGQG